MGKNSPWGMTGRFEIPILLLIGGFAIFLAGNFSFFQNALSLPQANQSIVNQKLIFPTNHPGSGLQESSFTVATTYAPSAPAFPSGPPSQGDVGYCRLSVFNQVFPGDDLKARQARCICIYESGGDTSPAENNLSCLKDGGTADYSIGLFQFNLLAWGCPGHPNPSVWYATCEKPAFPCGSSPTCSIKNTQDEQVCRPFYQDPMSSILAMVQVEHDQGGWEPAWHSDSNALLEPKGEQGCF